MDQDLRNKRLVRLAKLAALMIYLFSRLPTTGDPPIDEELVSRKVVGNGFHLILDTRLPKLKPECELGMIEHFPKQVYVDPYQIEEIARVRGQQQSVYEITMLPSKLDLEASADSTSAVEFSVMVKSTDWYVQLPFHVRYHPPTNKANRMVPIVIDAPIICSRLECVDLDFLSPKGEHEDDMVCSKHFGQEFSSFIPKHHHFDAITIQVPVGDTQQSEWVFLITVLAVLLGVIAIGKTALGKR